jgi:hypothetical protein
MGSSSRTATERLVALQGGGPVSGELVSMVRDGEAVIGESRVPESGELLFEATNIRHSRTGLHARTEISNGEGAVLAFDHFNLERDEDRRRLSNSAATRLGDMKRHGPAIRVRFDEFCRRVWHTYIRAEVPEALTAAEPTGVDWLIEPFVAKGAGTILYGPPKACKSWLGLLWSAALLTDGGPWRANRARVLFVNLERPAHTLRQRLWCIQRAVGGFDHLQTWNRRGRSLASMAPAIARHAESCDLIVVDSLSRSGTGDLNANDSANEAMDLLNSFGVAWCILAHTPRADTTHVYGSQMFDAAADFLVRVSSVVGADMLTRGVLLDRQAANDAPPTKAQLWAFDFDDRGLLDVRQPRAGEFPDLEPQAHSVPDRISEYLVCEGASTAQEIASELDIPQGTVRRILNTDGRFIRLLSGGKGRGSRSKWGTVTNTVQEPEH